ncbi:hypothetical protein F4781DRAFT_94665 [Annulohypoxylon bovei var. microspora]|nr:hypothetical protein F4781DRAFT_94665 [Annulohypoxylon bovei var. microspora]
MSADKKTSSFSKKRILLHKLRVNYRRLKAYLTLATYGRGGLEKDQDILARAEWAFRRTHKEGTRGQEVKERRHEGEVGQATLDRKIASYQNRVRRTSVQLLVAAAAGYQHRETNLATRQGGLIKGIHRSVPRKYRAFDVRRTPSLSSNEATARAVKNWINQRKAGLDSDSDSDSDGDSGDDGSSSSSSTLSFLSHTPTLSDDDDGSAIADMATAMMADTISMSSPSNLGGGNTPFDFTVQEDDGQPIALSRELYTPYLPDPKVYDPRRWRWLDDIEIEWLKDEFMKEKFKSRPNQIPVGRLTWKEQEKKFPLLNSILKMGKKDKSELWDPNSRRIEEMKMPHNERPPLVADINTKLSLERRRGFERREMNPLYFEYSRLPVPLPEKLSDEEMRRGPLPAPPKLPLISDSGQEVKLFKKTPSKIQVPPHDTYGRKRAFDDMVDERPLPVAQYHYPIDSPAISAFKFDDGKQVSDILKPGPLDEPRQVRGSQAIIDFGKETEKEQGPLKHPYTWEGMPKRPPPEWRPDDYDRNMTLEEIEAWKTEKAEASEDAQRMMDEYIQKEQARREEARANRGKPKPKSPSPENDPTKGALTRRLIETADFRREWARLHSDNPFWHYESLSDGDSSIHSDKKRKPNDDGPGS